MCIHAERSMLCIGDVYMSPIITCLIYIFLIVKWCCGDVISSALSVGRLLFTEWQHCVAPISLFLAAIKFRPALGFSALNTLNWPFCGSERALEMKSSVLPNQVQFDLHFQLNFDENEKRKKMSTIQCDFIDPLTFWVIKGRPKWMEQKKTHTLTIKIKWVERLWWDSRRIECNIK